MKSWFTIIALVLCITTPLTAQNDPFNCDYNAYLFQHNDVFAIDLASGSSYEVATDIVTGKINAAGYNSADGYIWGSLSEPEKTIVRIGEDFTTTTYTFSELPTNNRYIGDIDLYGVYHLKPGGTTYYMIDLDPASGTYLQFLGTGTLSSNIAIHDWAFNANDDLLYTVEKGTNHLYRVDPSTGTVTDLGEVPILTGFNYTYGAVYFDLDGNFYVSSNQTGTIYIVNDVHNLTPGGSISSNLFAYGPSSSSNDGARCPTAPVPQEDCSNGIDDDGDGLVDCDDPACSGVAGCPTQDRTSGGNDGGLESNDRLSQKINTRNYNRKKSNYRFNSTNAHILEKSANYATRNAQSNLSLQDFIPLQVIGESSAINSTPGDLIQLTNATDIYSVDYIRNDNTVAAIMAIKTENGVYEHTKYICDRFLGSELLSVSTLMVNDQQFLKSQIKNPDGSREFAASFSGRLVNNNTNFAIDGHWNLDKYQSNIPYYNFQIWASSPDDLLKLSEEVLRLLDVQRPIISYDNSRPPTVFVKKGNYKDGIVSLEVINKNRSSNLLLEGGLKRTETMTQQQISEVIDLETSYISELTIDTGHLFDVGFRLGNGSTDTPDDVFLSDGPWGLDSAGGTTSIQSYNVSSNTSAYTGNGMRVERNIALEANTDDYVAVYRAFNPRFRPVNLSGFNTIEFDAFGTGELEVRLIKNSINAWDDQYVATVNLYENKEHYYLPLSAFNSTLEGEITLEDITLLVFTLKANGTTVTKTLNVSDIELSQKDNSIYSLLANSDSTIVSPNPITTSGDIYFYAKEDYPSEVVISNQLGQVVLQYMFNAKTGVNRLKVIKNNLKQGIYYYNIQRKDKKPYTGKLMIR